MTLTKFTKPGNFEIGRILHLKSETSNWTQAGLSHSPITAISDFGFEVQDSSNFEIFNLVIVTKFRHCFIP